MFFRWYFGKIKRAEAEKKLLLVQNEHGAFLIRDSESRRNDYSLSVRDGDTVKHYRYVVHALKKYDLHLVYNIIIPELL